MLERIIDLADLKTVEEPPLKSISVLSNGKFVEQGYVVKSITLNQYVKTNDPKLGPYSVITSLVDTDKGIIEMLYDEGYRGITALEDAAKFLTSHLGISGLITRAIIQLDYHLHNDCNT